MDSPISIYCKECGKICSKIGVDNPKQGCYYKQADRENSGIQQIT